MCRLNGQEKRLKRGRPVCSRLCTDESKRQHEDKVSAGEGPADLKVSPERRENGEAMDRAKHHRERRGCGKKGSVSSLGHTGFECWPTAHVGESAEYVQPELKYR